MLILVALVNILKRDSNSVVHFRNTNILHVSSLINQLYHVKLMSKISNAQSKRSKNVLKKYTI